MPNRLLYAQVGVSIGINEPGAYRQINIGGGFPPPSVFYPQPVIIAPGSVAGLPMYLNVPPLCLRNCDSIASPIMLVVDPCILCQNSGFVIATSMRTPSGAMIGVRAARPALWL